MKFVGQYLKEIRIKNNLTIEELCKELKINQSLIQSIELDDFPEYLEPVYMMGHIRAYADLFDLDANDLIETFKIQISYNRLYENKQVPKPVKTTNFLSLTKTFYFASISIISISFYFMFVRPNNLDSQYAMTPDLPENLQYNLEEIELNLALSKKNNNDGEVIINLEEENSLSNSSSALASNSKNVILTNDDYKITLHFLNPTWIQLRDNDDNIIISRLMNEDEQYSYYALENLSLTAGNAGNIIVSLNGKIVGKVGNAGDVIESFIIDNNFKN
tara:strand:- start:54 stop:878 length:825 start_codon:yes stop_codon:yes gene_type:complete